MPRSTIKYQLIEDERARNATLKKRKASLIKKMYELKTLCGVDACLVMYEKRDDPPTVWPSYAEARRMIQIYDKSPKSMWSTNASQDHPTFMKKNVAKVKKQWEREKEKNMRNFMVKCLFDENAINEITSLEELAALHAMLVRELEVLNDLIEERKASSSIAGCSTPSSSNQMDFKNFL